jgi:hypothetical protein
MYGPLTYASDLGVRGVGCAYMTSRSASAKCFGSARMHSSGSVGSLSSSLSVETGSLDSVGSGEGATWRRQCAGLAVVHMAHLARSEAMRVVRVRVPSSMVANGTGYRPTSFCPHSQQDR